MVHADGLGACRQGNCRVGVAGLKAQLRAELFRPPGGIAFDAEALESHGELGFAAAVDQFQFIAGGKESLQPLAGQGAPGGSHHQHD